MLEVGNRWWDLKALHEDALLALDAHVPGPADEAGEVALGLDVSTEAEVLGLLLEEGVLDFGGARARHHLLLSFSSGLLGLSQTEEHR